MNPVKMLRDMRAIGGLLGDAERIARRMGDEQPAAEHLLLAALAMRDGAAARAMARFGVTGESLEQAIVTEHADALAAAGLDRTAADRLATAPPVEPATGSGPYRSDASAQELFQAAGSLARGSRQSLSSAHVVLAAADLERGTLARVLDHVGIERVAMREAARAEIT